MIAIKIFAIAKGVGVFNEGAPPFSAQSYLGLSIAAEWALGENEL